MIVQWARKRADLFRQRIERDWLLSACHTQPAAACEVYRRLNTGQPDAGQNYCPEIISRAVEFGFLRWPAKCAEWTAGRRVLDIGCGCGMHGVGFVVFGASSYTGVDPLFKPNNREVKHHGKGRRVTFGWTPAQVMQHMPRLELIRGTIDDLPAEARFDVVSLHNVTEHLIDLEGQFEKISSRLSPRGVIIFNHHNFCAWNGHHQQPKSIDRIDFDDPDQEWLIDWGHLMHEPPEGHYIRRKLNRIRLDDLRRVTERFFTIEQWEEIPTDRRRGRRRLSRAVRRRLPGYTERELLTQNVFCIARRRLPEIATSPWQDPPLKIVVPARGVATPNGAPNGLVSGSTRGSH